MRSKFNVSFSSGTFPNNAMKIAKVFQFLKLEKEMYSQIIDLFPCYHNFQRY